MKISIFLGLLLLCSREYGFAQGGKAPRYEQAICPECPFPKAKPEYLNKEKMSFGYLFVPENRHHNNGRVLRLAVAIIKSDDPGSREPPVIILQGGPGIAGLEDISRTLRLIRRERDIILLDQRGCGRSDPVCYPEASRDIFKLLCEDLAPGEEIKRKTDIALACRDSLLAVGADLAAYNSVEMAADVNDLRNALGYPLCYLLGISYGTRVALEMMRDYPGTVRGVILDSPIPPDAKYYEDNTINFMRSLKLLFGKCAGDSACRIAYPDLEKDFYGAVTALRKNPLTVTMGDTTAYPGGKFVVNAQDFLLAVRQALYYKELYPFLPVLIEQTLARKVAAWKTLLGMMKGDLLGIRFATYYAVLCNECLPFNSLSGFGHSSTGLRGGLSFYRSDFGISDKWNSERSFGSKPKPVSSSIPTVILSGELDPVSPPAYAQMVKAHLSNCYCYEFENEGHWVSNTDHCAALMQKFMHNPNVCPDSLSMIKAHKLQFLTDFRIDPGVTGLSAILSGRSILAVSYMKLFH